MAQDIMIDLEAMGQGANAAIIAVGAVEFDPCKFELGREFYTVVNLESSVKAGGVIDTSTILWWMKQSDAARREFERRGEDIPTALSAFATFVQDPKNARIWGNGASFDNVILNSAYQRINGAAPWKFWNDRCYRTIKNMFPQIPVPTNKTAHNALEDAKTQARHLIEIARNTGIFV